MLKERPLKLLASSRCNSVQQFNSIKRQEACCVDGGATLRYTELLATYIDNSEHYRFLSVLLVIGACNVTCIASSI